jgi:phospholipase A1/A2
MNVDAAMLLAAACAMPAGALAQQPKEAPPGWQACVALADPQGRLECFDRWSGAQGAAAGVARPLPAPATTAIDTPARADPNAVAKAPPPDDAGNEGCHDPAYTDLSRFWELERSSGCGIFGIRGYRPISLSLVASDSVNGRPTSENPLNTADSTQPYRTTETRLQLSVRTKLAQGLLTGAGPKRDSLWFGYTQQSYWQVFTAPISRPFRSTDHEPEFVYVYPGTLDLPGGWRLRYTGLGLVHQSNGQSLPFSRSWNRVYLMAGAEHGRRFTLQGRLWKRVPEDLPSDDNPEISDFIGRAELAAAWNVNADNSLALTLRHSLRSQAKGSARLEWLRTLGTKAPLGILRLHTQLFNGYGDSLLDYNRRRTVFGVGLSLVDW